MPKFVIDIQDVNQFSDGERDAYAMMKRCLKKIRLKDTPDLTLANFEVVTLKEARKTILQEHIVENVLKPMYRFAKCWDIDSVFWGYYGIHRSLQRHYLAINLALRKLHGHGETPSEILEDPSPLFLQMMDFELLVSLRAMSQDGVLPYKVLQFVVEENANHHALARKIEQDGKWLINPLYQIEDFAKENDEVDVLLEEAEIRNKKLLESLNAEIKNNEGLERRIVALTQELERLQGELGHYKNKKPGIAKQVLNGGAEIVQTGAAIVRNGLFGSTGKPKAHGKDKDREEPAYAAVNR